MAKATVVTPATLAQGFVRNIILGKSAWCVPFWVWQFFVAFFGFVLLSDPAGVPWHAPVMVFFYAAPSYWCAVLVHFCISLAQPFLHWLVTNLW